MSKKRTFDGKVAIDAHMALIRDREACGCTVVVSAGPSHSRDYFNNGLYFAYQCDSRSRSFNSTTGQMEGRAHCSCEGCF